MQTEEPAKVNFYFLSDIEKEVRVTTHRIQGAQSACKGSAASSSSLELLLECQLYVDGRELGMPVHTKYRHFPTKNEAKTSGVHHWHETLTFPVKYTDLSSMDWRTSMVVFRLWDLSPSPASPSLSAPAQPRKGPVERALIGEGRIRLISERRLLETGVRTVALWPPHGGAKVEGGYHEGDRHREDGYDPEGNVARVVDGTYGGDGGRGALDLTELNGPRVDEGISEVTQAATKGMEMRWLDKLESYRLQSIKKHQDDILTPTKMAALSQRVKGISGSIRTTPLLTISLPEFKYPVIAWNSRRRLDAFMPSGSGAIGPHAKLLLPQKLAPILPINHPKRLLVLHDPGMDKPNPIELKFQRLAKSFGQNASWLNVKPNGAERAALRRIIAEPMHMREIKAHDRELLWKFRYRLTTMKNTITRFLRCVDFNESDESDEALRMLPLWENEKTVTTEDALELLSEDFVNASVRQFAVKQLDKESNQEIENYLMLLVQALQYESKYPSPLSAFICKRSAQKLSMSNAVNWYLTVEAAQKPKMYSAVLKDFRTSYLEATDQGKRWKSDIEMQMEMVEGIRSLCRMVSTKGGKQSRRIENLRSALKSSGKFSYLTKFKRPVRFPLDPNVLVTGVVPEKSTIFASNAFPVLLAFQRHDSEEVVRVIFKDGDDLRQDQLIMQLVKLMDSRLKKQGLDLELISFQVQGWSASDGVVEFVPGCSTVASVIDEWKEISKFLQEHNPKPKLMKNALSNWVKSSAGYSVLTYILAIGDRHLDNILLTKDGHMLHIDFGYIFGRDPKPFPPRVKFTRDMMEAMGGPEFEEQFYEKSCLSYNLLRRDACLILNLIYLTGDWAGNKKDNLTVVRSRLLLEKDDEEAAKDYKLMVHKVMHSNFEALKDGIHTIATNLKK